MEGFEIFWSAIISIAGGIIAGWIMKGTGFSITANLLIGLSSLFLGQF